VEEGHGDGYYKELPGKGNKEMSVRIILFYILIASPLAQSCASRRLTVRHSEDVSEDVIDGDYGGQILKRNISGKDLIISRARIQYNSEDISRNVSGFFKYSKKGEFLLSLRSVAGIEVARIMIRKDSIKIHDRINNTLYVQSLNYMKKKYGIGAGDLVLLWGDIPRYMAKEISDNKLSGQKTFFIRGDEVNYEIEMDEEWNKVRRVKFKYNEGAQSEIKFENYEEDKELIYPGTAEINLDSAKINIKLKYSGVKREEIKSMKFSASKSIPVIVLK
jgi:hypothetical protein